MLPTLELRPVVNAFKGNANLKPLVLDSSRNLNPSLIKGLKGGTSAALRHTVHVWYMCCTWRCVYARQKPNMQVLHVVQCLEISQLLSFLSP